MTLITMHDQPREQRAWEFRDLRRLFLKCTLKADRSSPTPEPTALARHQIRRDQERSL